MITDLPPRDPNAPVAVFVDGDNMSAALGAEILRAGQGMGRVYVARVYSNRSDTTGWKEVAGFRLVGVGSGKNATDVILSLDALEFALTDEVRRFVIATSDGDFAHLAFRLRERGRFVLGMGEAKAPPALREACSAFRCIGNGAAPQVGDLDRQIREMIARHSTKGQGMRIAELGARMHAAHEVRISDHGEQRRRAYLEKRPGLFELVGWARRGRSGSCPTVSNPWEGDGPAPETRSAPLLS